MTVSDISLTAGMRTNLLSLQNTSLLLNRTQQRLSSGKQVNSALDNPTNYFAAQNASQRASDLADRTKRFIRLTKILESIPRVRRVVQANDGADVKDVASEAADGLLDIEGATRVLFNELLPRLESLEPGSPDIEGLLGDIGEEYRHIYYHIVNTKLFNYVVAKP